MNDVEIRLDHVALQSLDRAGIRALEKTGEALHADIVDAQVIPRRDNHLAGDGFYADMSQSSLGEVDLVHDVPYARRWFYNAENVTFSRTENPHATDHWTRPWESGGEKQDFAPKAFAKFYQREAGT